MDLKTWKTLSQKEQRALIQSFDALNGEGYDLAREVARDFEPHSRWPIQHVNVLNRFGELCIALYLENDDFQVASRYPEQSHLGFRIFFDSENNHFGQ